MEAFVRKQLLDQLAATIQRTLDAWTAENGALSKVERVALSLCIEKSARTSRADSEELLKMNVADFFSEVRLLAIGTPHQLAVRAANGIAHDWVWGGGRKRLTDTMNMQEFLDVYGSRELLRVPNLGKKALRGWFA